MADLIDDLRRIGAHTRKTSSGGMEAEARLMEQAADEIERLRATARAQGGDAVAQARKLFAASLRQHGYMQGAEMVEDCCEAPYEKAAVEAIVAALSTPQPDAVRLTIGGDDYTGSGTDLEQAKAHASEGWALAHDWMAVAYAALALPEKWRNTADALSPNDARSYSHALGVRACADELEAALSAKGAAGAGVAKPYCWLCEGEVLWTQDEADESRDAGGEPVALYRHPPQDERGEAS